MQFTRQALALLLLNFVKCTADVEDKITAEPVAAVKESIVYQFKVIA
jgi:hypothetical protein